MTLTPHYSIIIPAFNEEKRIEESIISIHSELLAIGKSFEIIVVDDGSKDTTLNIVQRLSKKFPALKLTANSENKGKGNAVRKGMHIASGSIVAFTDADHSTSLQSLTKAEEILAASKAHVAFGVRDPRFYRPPFFRKIVSSIGKSISQLLLNHQITDTQCGFKIFTSNAAKIIATEGTVDRFGFDYELIVLSQRHSLPIVEVHIEWRYQSGSTVKLLRDSLRTFKELAYVARQGGKFKAVTAQPRY